MLTQSKLSYKSEVLHTGLSTLLILCILILPQYSAISSHSRRHAAYLKPLEISTLQLALYLHGFLFHRPPPEDLSEPLSCDYFKLPPQQRRVHAPRLTIIRCWFPSLHYRRPENQPKPKWNILIASSCGFSCAWIQKRAVTNWNLNCSQEIMPAFYSCVIILNRDILL